MKETDFPPCPMRTRLVMYAADGTKQHVFRCTEASAPAANQNVTPEVCAECPVRRALLDDVHIPPTKRVREETKPDKGGDGFVKCSSRGVVEGSMCCGSTRLIRVCLNDNCHYFQGEVSPNICASCPVRTSEK